MTMPRAKVRCGSSVSPAEKVTYCQPSYAHSAPIIPVTVPLIVASDTCAGHQLTARGEPGPATINTTARTTMTPALSAVATACTLALRRVPRMLIAVTSTIMPSDTTFDPNGDSGTNTLA